MSKCVTWTITTAEALCALPSVSAFRSRKTSLPQPSAQAACLIHAYCPRIQGCITWQSPTGVHGCRIGPKCQIGGAACVWQGGARRDGTASRPVPLSGPAEQPGRLVVTERPAPIRLQRVRAGLFAWRIELQISVGWSRLRVFPFTPSCSPQSGCRVASESNLR
jgi:hypothetical protein